MKATAKFVAFFLACNPSPGSKPSGGLYVV